MAASPEVAAIVADNTIAAPAPWPARGIGPRAEPNIALIGAPDLWSLGFRGRGVTIASLDTGVDARIRTSPAVARRAGAWFDPYGQHASRPI